ncbi:GH15 family glucan-1,4-alpha-glucosidase [Pseudarthrobacter defluvii]|uniref:glycoside hydrolase family 15 protein n=1 Tax=Pseudarthrobacter defluvii TaxID=410837 RepID=UPI00277FAD3D|nr:glycoside hydrolase family 15 protein [Pseudarthrobacter defluvii]MDQ0769495.1 GH15 family glucan-1,4-alpha-glucosidase [Pseudarthrobacter defluvii]
MRGRPEHATEETDLAKNVQHGDPTWQPSPIPDYGLLGDTRTAALVSAGGSLDWLCAPAFDGEPIFGALLGGAEAGAFLAGPVPPAHEVRRQYRHHSATLETVWSDGQGQLILTEAMVADLNGQLLPTTLLIRRLSAEGSPMTAVICFDPRLGEQHQRPRIRRGRNLVCDWGPLALSLGCSQELVLEPGQHTYVTIEPGHPVTFVLAIAHGEPLIHIDPSTAWDLVETDEARWRAWADEVDEDIPFREPVLRSLLTLQLLTYSPSGAPVAAPTTSLPEDPGGIRNWDYRYAWPRDASIGVASFLGVGKTGEARKFLGWLLHASRLERPRLPALLTLAGGHVPAERTLHNWPGFAGSTPVRMGNGAASQHQLDGYGWVLDAAWVLVRSGHRLYSETWRAMRGFADLVARRWQDPDAGIWEIRDDAAHHVHSKMMGWLALDRALRIGQTHRLGKRQREQWQKAKHDLAAEIRSKGFDPARHTYTRTYGSLDLDAALLVLPVIGLEENGSSRVKGTVDAIREELSAGFPFLYRYPPGQDGLPGTEGAFLPCSFWLVQALAHTGQLSEATALFQALLENANQLGLYSEEIDPATGALLGNFPQALTHAALVQAALALRDAVARNEAAPGTLD